ncbi:MAG TPA: FHA domain-containing protein, partial [Thermoanaerobaculia bacterium]
QLEEENARLQAEIENLRESNFAVERIAREDLGSTNGTFGEGERIGGRVEISNQQEFVVGMTTLMLIVTPVE